MSKNNIRAMVEGAITVALLIVILYLMLYTPLGLFTFFIVPIPFIVYCARHSWKSSIAVGVVSIIVASLFISIFITPLVVYSWIVGLVLGISFARKDSGIQTIILGSITILALFLLTLLIAATIFEYNIVDEMVRLMDEVFTQSRQMLEGTFGQSFQEINIGEQIRLYFPSLLIINALLLGFVNYWIGYGLHKRLGLQPRPFPPLSEVRFPRSLIYYYIVVFILALIPSISSIPWIRVSLINILPVFDMIFIIQGVLFVFYFAKVRNMGKGLPIASIVLLFIPIVGYILKIIGIVDLAMNIREKFATRS